MSPGPEILKNVYHGISRIIYSNPSIPFREITRCSYNKNIFRYPGKFLLFPDETDRTCFSFIRGCNRNDPVFSSSMDLTSGVEDYSGKLYRIR